MKTSIKAALITGIFGIVGTVSAAIIGINVGKSTEQKSIQNEINEVMGDMVNVIGDGNKVTINDIKDLIKDYQELMAQNDSLTAQNTKYFDDLTKSNSQVEELQKLLEDIPDIQYKDLGLSINGNIIPINSSKSSVVINNRTYLSDDFIKNLISSDTNMSVQDNTIYIGKIIKNKSFLIDQWEFGHSDARVYDSVTDSYGKMYTNSLVFPTSNCYITYNLNREFSLLRFSLSVRDNAHDGRVGTLVIKADDEIVYTSPELSKTTEQFEVSDIPINNCSLLTLEYNAIGENDCIMSDIEIYN